MRSVEHKYSADVIDATTLQVLDTTDFPPVTETQTPSTHHGTPADAGRTNGDPITISTLANQTHRSGDWSLNPIPALSARSGRGAKAGWAFRLAGLVVLIALAAAFGSSRLPDTSRLTNRGNQITAPAGQTPDQSVAQAIPTSTLAINATNDPTRDAAETAVALGVGGETVEPSSFPSTVTSTASATSTPEPTATATATTEPTATEPSTPVTAADLPGRGNSSATCQ